MTSSAGPDRGCRCGTHPATHLSAWHHSPPHTTSDMNAGLSSSQVSLDFPRNLSLSSDAKVHRPIRVMCMSFPSDVLYWVNFSAKALGTFVCEGSFESGKPSHTLVSSLFTGSSCFFCAEDDQWFQATTFARTSSSFTLSLSTFIQGKVRVHPCRRPMTRGVQKSSTRPSSESVGLACPQGRTQSGCCAGGSKHGCSSQSKQLGHRGRRRSRGSERRRWGSSRCCRSCSGGGEEQSNHAELAAAAAAKRLRVGRGSDPRKEGGDAAA